MTRYKYSRKQIEKWIREREGFSESWYPVDEILKRLVEKAKPAARPEVIETLTHDFYGRGWEIERSIQGKINELVEAVNELRRAK